MNEPSMTEPSRSVSVADAKAHLSEILDAVEKGEHVEITKRGIPVADLVPKQRARPPIDLEWLRSVAAELPASEVDAVQLVREMRDAARY